MDNIDVLLINPFHETHIHSFSWGVFSNASYLNAKGYNVAVLDGCLYLKNRKIFFDRMKSLLMETKLVGFTCFTTDVWEVKQLIDFAKHVKPDIKVVVGGPHAVLMPEQTCSYKDIDFVAYGDGEKTLEQLIIAINDNDDNYAKVPGMLYKKDGKVFRTQSAGMSEFYDMNYEMLEEKKRSTYGNYLQVLTGRGCSFKCTFCYNAITGQKWLPRPIDDVMDEIERLVRTYNTKQIYFRDENFFQSKKRIAEFIKAYRDRGFSFKWRATIRANYFNDNYIDFELLKELEDINCSELKFGLESGSERVLRYLKKGIKINVVQRMIKDMSKVKIVGNYSFLIGVPTEDYEEYKMTLRLVKYIMDTDPSANVIGPQYYRVYPGGELYDTVVSDYGFMQPSSFEEWAAAVKDDNLGLSKAINYPWVANEHSDIVKYSDMMMLLYSKSIYDVLTPKKIFSLPFVLLAKVRVKVECYRYMYDIKVFAWLFGKLHTYY